jgi:nucleolar GTP-binding protein
MEKRELVCPENLRRLPTYSEVRERILEIGREPVPLSKSVSRKALVKYSTRVDRVFRYVENHILARLREVSDVLKIPFYRELASNAVPEGVDLLDTVGRLSGKLKAIRKLYREYRTRVLSSIDRVEAEGLYREYVGRVLSVVRRLSKDIELLNSAVDELRKTPCIDFSKPIVAVAGLPQVGKSTLVATISSAKPRSSPFPFTTKEIIVGHVGLDGTIAQILDLPGILDRPPEEMNRVERKAFIALTTVAQVIVFLVDPSEDFYYGFESQLNLLKAIRDLVGRKMVVAVNKIDKVSEERLAKVTEALMEAAPGVKLLKISALRRLGLGELLDTLKNLLGEARPEQRYG